MNVVRALRHIFLPGESNNQKPKIFHASGLLSLKVLIIVVQLALFSVANLRFPKVLGYAANISTSEVIRLTNEKRAAAGLPALVENPILSQAAQAKGTDMINKDYWAHVAPDGTQPWYFFTTFGYSYRYAGENLARDFPDASSAVEAWMASPTHKENMLSPNYKDIGIGVVEGDLNGVDTTIIVQFFGTKYADTISQPLAKVGAENENKQSLGVAETPEVTSTPIPTPIATPFEEVTNQGDEALVGSENVNLVSPFQTTKDVSLIVLSVLLIILIIDAAITSKKKIKRIGGRSFAHIAFLGMILAVILILKAGRIL